MREKISQTLKAKWEEPEFREKMMTRSFPRTDEWRALVSEKIRAKWDDPSYRAAVTVGIQNSNKSVSVHRLRPPGPSAASVEAAAARRLAVEGKKRARAAVAQAKARDSKRRVAMQQGRAYVRAQAGLGAGDSGRGAGAGAGAGGEGKRSLKEVLGKEVWFEEKMRRRRSSSDPYLDDRCVLPPFCAPSPFSFLLSLPLLCASPDSPRSPPSYGIALSSALEAVLWGEWSKGAGTAAAAHLEDEEVADSAGDEEEEEEEGGWEYRDDDRGPPDGYGYEVRSHSLHTAPHLPPPLGRSADRAGPRPAPRGQRAAQGGGLRLRAAAKDVSPPTRASAVDGPPGGPSPAGAPLARASPSSSPIRSFVRPFS